ncbi:DNA cytosine methyltransferase [Candidatus Pacearchaeota archaeon]|nr:DNA cytosine methyltransferase [Candidatus Pacearchaeota archaeon]MBI2056716.1 DNA cytosine methyltransferase [Candidatus Pacearchaeota archaeon]
MVSKTFNYIDLFAGCGGISLGLYNSGWKGIFAVEKDPMAFATLNYNLIEQKKHFHWPEWIPKKEFDILKFIKEYKEELKKLEGKIDLVVGGPPCQGFSMAGRRKEEDKRNNLFDAYINFIKIIRPKVLLFENVKGFTIGFKKGDKRGEAFSNIAKERLKKIGYDVEGEIVNFADLSVPQRRKRFILIGFRKNLNKNPKEFFKKLYENNKEFCREKEIKERNDVGNAISDLLQKNGEINSTDSKSFKQGNYGKVESSYQKLLRENEKIPDSHRFAKHNILTIKKFKYILEKCPKNSNIDDKTKEKFNLKKRCIIPLCVNSTSPTLTTLPDDYIHYSEPRILTIREYSRIQSFPDWFKIKGKYTTGGKRRSEEVPRYTQVGNAIPPLGGEQFGNVLMGMLK